MPQFMEFVVNARTLVKDVSAVARSAGSWYEAR